VKLALFDIDGTLLSCGGAGMTALQRAADELFDGRVSFDGISPAGGMDPHLFAAALERSDALDLESEHDAFRDRYLVHLEETLAEMAERLRVHDGAVELVQAIRARADEVTLGLLTRA
jgi:phosphoglycolate phosphatase-like HAD superfamily hydrolase